MQGGRKSDCLALAAPGRAKGGDNGVYNITQPFRVHLMVSRKPLFMPTLRKHGRGGSLQSSGLRVPGSEGQSRGDGIPCPQTPRLLVGDVTSSTKCST